MARKSVAKNTAEEVVETVSEAVEKDMNENVVEESRNTIKEEPLKDDDEIEVVSVIPNVSYKDSKTGDFYEWDEAGHVEYMTFDTLKNMWRNYKGYFRNMWLKPKDDRVINKFGLKKTYDNYEFLMDESNYTRKKIDEICEGIKNTPNGMKMSICNKVKDLVINGEITDVQVIKKLEKHLNLDLIEFL